MIIFFSPFYIIKYICFISLRHYSKWFLHLYREWCEWARKRRGTKEGALGALRSRFGAFRPQAPKRTIDGPLDAVQGKVHRTESRPGNCWTKGTSRDLDPSRGSRRGSEKLVYLPPPSSSSLFSGRGGSVAMKQRRMQRRSNSSTPLFPEETIIS